MYFHCVCMLMHMPLQITDTDLMELIRTNVKLTIPYAGAFLKKEDRYTSCARYHICSNIGAPLI